MVLELVALAFAWYFLPWWLALAVTLAALKLADAL
jgi:hypothetical protein